MKKIAAKGIISVLIFGMLVGSSGCSKEDVLKAPEITRQSSEQTDAPTEETVEEASQETTMDARQAYMAFLKGEISVSTDKIYEEDDKDGNFDGITYGTYTIQELKEKLEEKEDTYGDVKYAFLDLGEDGTEEMALCFEGTAPLFMNWTGIFCYDGEDLALTGSYSEGYRTPATLYSTGYVAYSGTYGVGGTSYWVRRFDEKGREHKEFSLSELYGIAATEISYSLDENNPISREDYPELEERSDMMVSVYQTENVSKIAVQNLSENANIRKQEEKLIDELVGMGAELISTEEMEKLSDFWGNLGTEVEFEYYNGDGEVGAQGEEAPKYILRTRYFMGVPQDYGTEFQKDGTFTDSYTDNYGYKNTGISIQFGRFRAVENEAEALKVIEKETGTSVDDMSYESTMVDGYPALRVTYQCGSNEDTNNCIDTLVQRF